MVFCCHNAFRLDTKCEWKFLAPFVEQFNKQHGTEYQHKRCLDIDKELRKTPQPEVLVEDGCSGQKMVIERKSIVWPEDHIKCHKGWHHKSEMHAKLQGGYYEESFVVEQEPAEILQAREAALRGFTQAYLNELPSVSKKFRNWPNTLRVYVVQFIGNDNWVSEDDVESIIKEAETPIEINQVWAAYPKWVNEEDYSIAWKHVR